MKDVSVVEITKDNYPKYLEQVANLEEVVLKKMETSGQAGQFFTTGYDDVLDYVLSEENTVLVAINEEDKVQAAAYITEGQIPYTYNDITKYFKNGEAYKEWVRSQYETQTDYIDAMLSAYELKMEAYKHAKERILSENPEYTSIIDFLNSEKNAEGNGFHEKSVLRNNINKYMSEYIKEKDALELYEKFYWTTSENVGRVFGKNPSRDEDVLEYEEILKNMSTESIEKPNFNVSEYYTANTSNAVEIDTYITDPKARASGIAKILVYEGIKSYIEKHFADPSQKEVFLCSTLHRLNVSSKYVSEFFGLKDSLYVNRRFGRTREVHMKKINREEATQYLDDMYAKMAVLHGYNPENREIPKETVAKILKEEKEGKVHEVGRLKKLRSSSEFEPEYKRYLHFRVMGLINGAKGLRKKEKEIDAEDRDDER